MTGGENARPPRYSLVVPVHNEAGNIGPLLAVAGAVLDTQRCELIVVDDGSTDGTMAEVTHAMASWSFARCLHQPVNLGQNTALLAGLRAARGELILTMDGDGQNDPVDFPRLLAPVEAGSLDLACGRRIERHDSWLRRSMSGLANGVRSRLLHDGLHDTGCQLRVMRREVVEKLFPFELLQSFLPAIVVAAGFRVGEFPVQHHARRRGQSHYGFRQLWWRPAVAMLALRHRLKR